METISPQSLKEKLYAEENILVLDVREDSEYKEWHIPRSVNYPLSSLVKEFMTFSPPHNDLCAIRLRPPLSSILLEAFDIFK